jgi:tetratricopeptide (TPR) repeat protein
MRTAEIVTSRSSFLLLVRVSIVAAGLLAFSNGFNGRFFLDDTKVIIENARLRHLLPGAAGEWVGPRALVDLTFAFNYATGKLNPADYHAVNLLSHLIAGLLLFGLVRRTMALDSSPDRIRLAAVPVAWIAALTWVVHPLAGAAVQYVCQRYELLAGLCALLTLYAVVRAATPGARRTLWQVVAVAACLAGMSCKETMVVIPPMVLAFDRIFLGASWREVWGQRRLFHAGLFATVLYLALPLVFPGLSAGVHDYQPEGLSLAYLAAQMRVVSLYLRLAVWPHPLCLDYGWTSTPASFGGPWAALPALLFVVMTAWLFIRSRWRLGFAGLAFLLLLAPTSSIFPHPDLAFDHRMYLPLAALAVGWACLLVGAAGRLVSPVARSLCIAGPVLGVVIALGATTYERNREFQDAVEMWRSVLNLRPDNTRAAVCLTGELYDRRLDREVIETASRVLTRLPPLDPQSPLDQRRRVDVSKLLNNMGLAQLRESRPAEAVSAFRRAVVVAPGNIRARLGLASAVLAAGDTNAALREVSLARQSAPRNPEALQAEADLLAITGSPREAAGRYRQALEWLPDQPVLLGRLAWLLATCPDAAVRDGAASLRLAQSCVRQTDDGSGSEAFETLAAALAEAGDPARAAALQAQVIEQLGTTPVRQARLESYRAGHPWREGRFAPVQADLPAFLLPAQSLKGAP